MAAAAREYALGRRWDASLAPLYRSWREAARRRAAAVPAEDFALPRPAAPRS
jgi:hypothetical protein